MPSFLLDRWGSGFLREDCPAAVWDRLSAFAVLPPAVQRVCVKPVERATASAIHVAQAYTPLLLCFQPATGSFKWFGYLMLYLNQSPASLQHVPGALVGWQSCSCGPLGLWGRQGCSGCLLASSTQPRLQWQIRPACWASLANDLHMAFN